MTRDEQARQRLVEIAQQEIKDWAEFSRFERVDEMPHYYRKRAGFRDPSKGSWCAAGLSAAMEDAGLLVPAPGTPARRGAIALLEFVAVHGRIVASPDADGIPMYFVDAQPGDIVAWKQNPEPAEWIVETHGDGLKHAFSTATSPRSMCGNASRENGTHGRSYMEPPTRCSSCVWDTRKGHVAVIVATDRESITTVGWNEGASPGRVMMRRLWRDPQRKCEICGGVGCSGDGVVKHCPRCKGTGRVARSSTVLWRRVGGLAGIARPVAA